MIQELILGIDTSNYTTSLALMDLKGNLVSEARRLLPVQEGSLGLRQSDALFQHVKNLPELCRALLEAVGEYRLVGVSGAIKPRPLEESYMPVFLAASSYGETISQIMQVPFFPYSHQEGHIEAGLWSAKIQFEQSFLAFHLSGGTTELLLVRPEKEGYHIDIIGGSSDISAGQMIDRVGVRLGLPFPAGPHLEALANKWKGGNSEVPMSIKGTSISFSGPETFFQRLIVKGTPPEEIAYLVLQCIGKSLAACIKNAGKQQKQENILLVGGVASNQIIKHILENKLEKAQRLCFGEAKYCSDNAVGISALGVKKIINYRRQQLCK